MFRLLVAALLVGALASQGAVRPHAPAVAGSADFLRDVTRPLGGRLLLMASGGIGGVHEPCGCVRLQAGGVARRVGLEAALAEVAGSAPRIWVDAGGFAAPAQGRAGTAKTAAILRSFQRVGVAGVNVGAAEVEHGLEAIARLAADTGIRLTSASLVAEDGRSVFSDALVVDVSDGSGTVRVGLVGIMAHDAGLRSSLGGRVVVTRPASEALAAGVRSARAGGADLVVALGALPVAEARAALAAVAGVDVLVGADGSSLAFERGPPCIAYTGERGQDVVELAIEPGRAGGPLVAERYHHLDPRYPEDAEMRQLQLDTRRSINEWHRQEALEAALVAPPTGAARRFAGGTACRPCHVGEHLTWEGSRHRRALASLEEADSQWNPECLGCHVTGLGQGGFRSVAASPAFGGVQCESCHGAGAEHVATGGRTPMGPVVTACIQCHDVANSPGFDPAAAWDRIRHGPAGGALRGTALGPAAPR